MVLKHIRDLGREIADAGRQTILYKNKEKSNKCRVVLLTDNRLIVDYPGLLSKNKKLLYVPQLERTFYNPVRYISEKGETVIFIPERTHGDYGVSEKIIKNVAKAQKYELWVKWKNWDRWISTEIFLVEGTIDFNLFDNKWSIDLSSQTHAVGQAKHLSFLFEMADSQKLIFGIACILFGVVLGGIIL